MNSNSPRDLWRG